jgi:hypothetical protein
MAAPSITKPVHLDLARLEHDPDALWDYYREIERRIALLPPLSETLRQPSCAVRTARLKERATTLGVATIQPESMLLLIQLFQEEGLDMAAQLFGPHAATLHARDKQALLPRDACVQKTVSLLLGRRYLLVSRIGDGVLERAEQRAIAAVLGLSRKAARQATLNPPGFVVEHELGLLRGMVSPFLPAGFGGNLHAIVQLAWPTAWEEVGRCVAISLSPCESVLVPLRCYRRILRRYVYQSLLDLPLIELQAIRESSAVCHTTGVASHATT